MKPTAATLTQRFLSYLADEDLLELLPEIADKLKEEAQRRQEITIISAVELETTEKRALEKTVTEKWGEHPVKFNVDPILLSGLIIKFTDHVIDMSGRKSVTDLTHHLK